jgi:hypothetical protein
VVPQVLKTSTLIQEIRFPGASGLSIRMLPGSQLNPPPKANTEGDKLIIYKDSDRQQMASEFGHDKMGSTEIHSIPGVDAIWFAFNWSDAASGDSKVPNSALGYFAEVVAEYPFSEVIVSSEQPYTAEDDLGLEEPMCLSFDYAQKIDIQFKMPSSTAWDDELIFYRDAECKDIDRSFSGPIDQFSVPYTYQGSALWYKFVPRSNSSGGQGFSFRARPQYKAEAETDVHQNIRRFFKLEASQAQQPKPSDRDDDGLKQLLMLTRHADESTQR